MDAELAGEVGATVYQVGVYCSIRDPTGDAESVRPDRQADLRGLPRAHQRARRPRPAPRAARVHVHAAARRSTRCDARRRYAQRNIAHCVPLTSSRCGCPDGLILGTADPGGTLERLDPYDRQFADDADADRRQGRRRQDSHRDPARLPVHRPGRADLHHRPQLHP